MFLNITYSWRIKKDLKKVQHNKKIVGEFFKVTSLLSQWEILPRKYWDHKLVGHYFSYRECHIFPDVLLIYKINNNDLTLFLLRLWNHNELF
jgi:mRNA interferase YafQ